MKKHTLFLAKFIFFILLASACSKQVPITHSSNQNFPIITGFVNDYAKILEPQFKEKLEQKLKEFERKTSNEIVVVILPSLEEKDLETYSMALFNHWGIGKKVKNNGVGFLIFMQDRKLRIEVGLGLEKKLTDEKAKNILDNFVTPAFKVGRYQEGISSGVEKIMESIEEAFVK